MVLPSAASAVLKPDWASCREARMPAHLITCQIRWVDMDAYRHVNNTLYFRYCEQARTQMLGFEGSAEAAVESRVDHLHQHGGLELAGVLRRNRSPVRLLLVTGAQPRDYRRAGRLAGGPP